MTEVVKHFTTDTSTAFSSPSPVALSSPSGAGEPSIPLDNYTNTLNMTIWNANGCARHTISAITDAMPNTTLLFMVETWLLSPLQYPTPWGQYHTYAIPVEGNPRGQMGISLFVHPDCPYPVTHFPSTSPYVLSCQVSTLLIHCVYFPPALSDAEALDILTD
ncbi:hypothetical protein G6F47_013155 [Rhizopus delemar]|nr:hypothetical protein G6F52_012617 [Rhizopus delemar]KAG1536303.1 hypothetical protein G6F49_013008 [Rhizopus delemar]KAG1576968.1 hypothetical protein G6F48_012950 [Rhizopus delemar]KAG1577263.1 hypothetical protein G6F47_013155 [Rhizopus delemar]